MRPLIQLDLQFEISNICYSFQAVPHLITEFSLFCSPNDRSSRIVSSLVIELQNSYYFFIGQTALRDGLFPMRNLTTFFSTRMFDLLAISSISSFAWKEKPHHDFNFDQVALELSVVPFSNKLYLKNKVEINQLIIYKKLLFSILKMNHKVPQLTKVIVFIFFQQQLFFRNLKLMSDEQEQMQNQEEEEEQNEDQQQQEEDEEEEGDDDQNDDQDEDQDEDQDGDEDQEDQQDQNEQSQKGEKEPPSFKPVSEQFAFKNLLAQIASIGNSVDHFINTLPSRGGSGYRSYQPRIEYDLKTKTIDSFPSQEKKYTIMKDEDVQVSMQPQIVIQQTLTPKEETKKEPYKISNQSTKFLAQLYEENKKLKRWQSSQTGSYGNNWHNSKQKFERPEHERGLINLDDRNKQIDQAIQMLRRQDNQKYE